MANFFLNMADYYTGLIRTNYILVVGFIGMAITAAVMSVLMSTSYPMPIEVASLMWSILVLACVASVCQSYGCYLEIKDCKLEQQKCRRHAVQYGETR